MHVELLQHADSLISFLLIRVNTVISLRDICDSCWLACTFSLKLSLIGVLNFTDKLALVKLFGEQPFSSLLERR